MKKKTVRITVIIPLETRAKIKEIAKITGKFMHVLYEDAINSFITNNLPEKEEKNGNTNR